MLAAVDIATLGIALGFIDDFDCWNRANAPLLDGGPSVYSPSDRVSLPVAIREANFDLVLPNHKLANNETVRGVFSLDRGHAVILLFPADAPRLPLRTSGLEIFQTPSSEGDPEAQWRENIRRSPGSAEALYRVGGVPALGVQAHAPEDADCANPAFLRFVHRGVEFQISGGESLTDLIEIAKTLIS